MSRVHIIFADAGFGHRITAEAVGDVLVSQLGSEVALYEAYHDLLAELDFLKRLTGLTGPQIYNEYVLRRSHTACFWIAFGGFAKLVTAAAYGIGRRYLEAFWVRHRPDLVISVLPLLNKVIADSMRSAIPTVPLVTLMTDFAEPARGMWIQSKRQILICGTDKAAAQARRFGLPESQIFQTSGMVIPRRYYTDSDQSANDALSLKLELGLHPDLKTVLMMFGGYGMSRMLKYARILEESKLPLQTIYICGYNAGLANAIKHLPSGRPRAVLPFVPDPFPYLRMSDVLITKPGPSSISIAIQMRIPLLVEYSYKTLIQERYNARWVRENGAGLTFASSRSLTSAIATILAPERGAAIRSAMTNLQNRAVFEVAEIVSDLFHEPRACT